MAARKAQKPAAKTVESKKDQETISKIQRLAQSTLRTVKTGENPALELRIRALSNVSFNEKRRIIELGDKTQSREFFNTAMARKFMQTFLIADKCRELIEADKTVTIRQMYYLSKHTVAGSNENTFEDQGES